MCAVLISSWIRRSSDLTKLKQYLLGEQLAVKDSIIYELVIIIGPLLDARRLVHASDGAVDDYGFERGEDEQFWSAESGNQILIASLLLNTMWSM